MKGAVVAGQNNRTTRHSLREPQNNRELSLFSFLRSLAVVTLAFTVFCPMTFALQDASEKLRDVQSKYTNEIRPLLETHCGDCHWGDNTDADLNLEKYVTLDQLLEGRDKWRKVMVRVAAKEMPPEDSDPIADEDHSSILAWLDNLMNSVDCTDINPGRVTIRRLNRVEYRNTVRDLTGIDYKPSSSFPGDDVGYGFDNIADVLSLPPILMEKYLNAAEAISFQAIDDPDQPRYIKGLSPKDYTRNGKKAAYGGLAYLSSNGTLEGPIEFKESGAYRVSVQVGGDQAGAEPVKLAISLDGRRRRQFRTKREKDSLETVELEFKINQPGVRNLQIEFLNDYYNGASNQDRNLIVGYARIEGPIGKRSASHKRIVFVTPTKPSEEPLAAKKILRQLACKAYRRRVTPEELDRLMQIYEFARKDKQGFDAGIRFAMQAILVSPHFLFKVEQPVAKGQTRALNDFELATSLSYFLWSTMPDEELFRVAAKGKLSDPKTYRKQVARMLKDRRSLALVQNFVSQWLHLRSLDRMQPDPDLFPGVDRQLRQDMATETKLLVADLIRQDAPLMDLLSVPYTFMNERLAKHYGVANVKGSRFQKVVSKSDERVGLLTHASILTLTSNPNRTSPVKRGKWIMENLLGEEPPPPDPDAMQLEDQAELSGTLRQRMEQHRADPACAVCHRVMDELGFALEHYDPVGRYRERDGSDEIDPRGELPNGTRFLGPGELQKTIRIQMRDKFIRCLTEKMLIYSLGRGLEYYDDCTIDEIVSKVDQADFRFSSLVHAITESQPFLSRTNK